MSIKRLLVGYLWTVVLTELERTPRISDEANVAGVTLLGGFVFAPVVVGAYVWWLITGKRLPGRLGSWVGSPAKLSFGSIPRRPPPKEMRETMERPRARSQGRTCPMC
jgi:hypothetical protein